MKNFLKSKFGIITFLFIIGGMLYAGSDTIPARSPGQVISASHMNTIRNALNDVFYPRNSSGVVTDLAGDLGSTTYRWDDLAVKRILLGEASSNIQLKDNSGVFNMLVSGQTVVSVNSTGQDGQYLRSATVPLASLVNRITYQDFSSSNSNWSIPSGVQTIYVQACGAGGGGGGGGSASTANNSDGGGGGGGSSGTWLDIQLSVVGVTSVAISIPSGGAGGAHGTAATDNASDGSNGSATTIVSNTGSFSISVAGGIGGGKGRYLGSPGSGGAGGDATAAVQKFVTDGGAGEEGDDVTGDITGAAGGASVTLSGGAGGDRGQDSAGQAGGGGGGGGGASNFAAGGAGGDGGDASSSRNGYAGTAGTICSGGGGGGAGSAVGATSYGGDGGAGGPGYVRIWYF